MIAYPVSVLTELALNELLSPSASDRGSVSVPNLPSSRQQGRAKATMKPYA